jgi:hypothetical protein|tara:strand:- start:2144 stop:2542 length:399 start_codon:yes stop_codon:yes gene_type:complete
MLKIRGKITKILEPEVKETKGGKLYIQKVILDNNPDYENQIMFQFLGDSYKQLDFKEGQEGEMYFYINGRKWNDKYFVNLTAKKFEADVSIAVGDEVISNFEMTEKIEQDAEEMAMKIQNEFEKDEKDDLPF